MMLELLMSLMRPPGASPKSDSDPARLGLLISATTQRLTCEFSSRVANWNERLSPDSADTGPDALQE